MPYLLDTHAALWAFETPPRQLSEKVREILSTAPDEKFVSPISAYELGFKAAAGKMLKLPSSFQSLAKLAGFSEMPVSIAQAELAAWLSLTHRDPWDRLLAAQAIDSGSILITIDSHIEKLGVRTIW